MPGDYGGQLAEKLTGFVSIDTIIPFVEGLVLIAIICGLGIFFYKKQNWVCKAWILEDRGSGGKMGAEDYITAKKKKDGTTDYSFQKSKAPVRELTLNHLYPLNKRKNVGIFVKGADGYCVPADVVLDYVDENGDVKPYIKPIDVDLRDWAFKADAARGLKYNFETMMDKLKPFMTIAITGIICVIILHLTMKNMAALG